jgi:hypothetical protein
MITALIDSAKLILGFLPWFLFLFLPTDGWNPLRRAVLICLAASVLFGWKMLRQGFILQWATTAFFLFCSLSLYGFRWVWLATHMGIIANGFLDGVIWFTVLTGKPFTLQYARAELPREQWNNEGLIRSCRIIAIFWGTILLVPIALGAFRLFHPHALSDRFSLCLSLSCIAIGTGFTTFYKQLKRRQRENMPKVSIAP